uniref:Serine/threonine-protein phosphatase 4 regulatory subunit 3-like central domain-containing protein n=1 Tax=Arcella intermedia TaxID=1963864 RepID=A0A6B2L2K7_9EUKA
MKKEVFTLQELLDEDDVVHDTKNRKVELVAFLSKEENISQLLKYIVCPPLDEANQKEKFRYPVVASEILVSPIPELHSVLVQGNTYLDMIFNFFVPAKVDLMRASLVVNVLGQLCLNNTKQSLTYIQSHPEGILNIARHIEISNVTGFLVRVLHFERDEAGLGIQKWLVDIGLVDVLYQHFSPENHLHSDAANCITELVNSGYVGPTFLEGMIDTERSLKLLELVFSSASSFRYGMSVFLVLLRYLASFSDLDFTNFTSKLNSSSPLSERLGILKVIFQNLARFTSILKGNIDSNLVSPTEGFGFVRLRVLQLFLLLLSIRAPEIIQAILDSEVPFIAFDLLVQFPNNNFAHQAVESFYSRLWEISDADLRYQLLIKTNLPKRILLASPEAQLSTNTNTNTNPNPDTNTNASTNVNANSPYVPYLHIIAVGISRIATTDPIKGLLEGLEGWQELMNKANDTVQRNESQRRGFMRPPGRPN